MVVHVSSWDGMACVFDPVIKYVCSNSISSIDSKCNAQRNHGKPFDSNVQLGWDGMAYVFDHSKCNAHRQTTGSIRFAIGMCMVFIETTLPIIFIGLCLK